MLLLCPPWSVWESGGIPPVILNLGTASRPSNWPFPRGWWVMWCYTDIPPKGTACWRTGTILPLPLPEEREREIEREKLERESAELFSPSCFRSSQLHFLVLQLIGVTLTDSNFRCGNVCDVKECTHCLSAVSVYKPILSGTTCLAVPSDLVDYVIVYSGKWVTVFLTKTLPLITKNFCV